MNILVVDDEEVIRDSLQEFLISEGHDCQTAEIGQDALERLKKYSPDIVISDMLMPDMDGLALVKRIDQDYTDKQMEIILITGHADKFKLATVGNHHRVVDVMKNPIDISKLRNYLL